MFSSDNTKGDLSVIYHFNFNLAFISKDTRFTAPGPSTYEPTSF